MRARILALVATVALLGGSSLLSAAPAHASSSGHGRKVIVRIDPSDTSIARVNELENTMTVEKVPGLEGTYLVSPPDGADPAAVADNTETDAGVVYAEPDGEASLPEVTADRIYRWSGSDPTDVAGLWAAAALDLDGAHALATGAGQTVAVIDSGVELLPSPHPDLAASLVPGTDFVDGDNVPDDEANGVDDDGNGLIDEASGHGTHVAGIVHQVAPDAKIMPIRVLDSDGNGSESNVARAMLWAASHGATVVNLSLGQTGSSTIIKDAAEELRRDGVVVVAAAGNDGGYQTEFPASIRCVLGVAGTDRTDTVSTFSTLGSWVDVGAPAEDVQSTFPFFPSGYATWSGTSMASPFVAGQAALLLSMNRWLSVGDVMTYIKGTTVPYTVLLPDAGRGRIAPTASLQALAAHNRPSVWSTGVDSKCFDN